MAGRRTERFEAVIIGGGQAGLSTGYWLAEQDIDFVILDAEARVGDVWRKRWDSLRLFTPARYSSLPGLPFPGDPYDLPTRDAVADYLEWYARLFDLPVRSNTRVSRVGRRDGHFIIETQDRDYEAENVIIATGPFHTPRIPSVASQLDGRIVQLHSSEYRSPEQLPSGPALVVGAGNSGAQIALELVKSRDVLLAGRPVGAMPRRLLGRDVFDWLTRTVMRPSIDSRIGRRIRRNVVGSTDALIGMTERDLTRAGIRRGPRVVGAKDGRPVLADGSVADVASVVWSTGFKPNFNWIDLPAFGDDGFPRHYRGAVRELPGLFFVGLRFQYRLNSSLIGGVGADAQHVAESVLERYGETRRRTASHFSGRREGAYK